MANKTITVPLTDHDANCTTSYLVEWKLSTDANYVNNTQFSSQIVIENVLDNSMYDVRITRNCCNGGTSAPLILSVDTTSNSPQLAQPTGLGLTPASEALAADCNDVVNATSYVFQLAKDNEFTVDFQEQISATSDYNFTGLESGTAYYCRVKARASGYADSIYSSTVSGTPA